MSIQEIFEVMVYPDPRIAKLLANPHYREGIEDFIQNDMGGDVENLITAAHNKYGSYEDVTKDEREEYICMILSYLCNYLDIDQSEIMDDAIIPVQSKDIKMPPLGVNFSDEYEQEPNYNKEDDNPYNSESSDPNENIGESSEYAEDNSNPDDDPDDETPPHGDDEDDLGSMDPFLMDGNNSDAGEYGEDYDREPDSSDGYREPGEDDEMVFDNGSEIDSKKIELETEPEPVSTPKPTPAVVKEEIKKEPVKVEKEPEPIKKVEHSEPKPAISKTPAPEVKKEEVKETKTVTPIKDESAIKNDNQKPKVVEKIVEKIIIHNAPKREFKLYEETDDFLREIDEESVKDEDDIDINLLWNMINDMYIWRRRVEKKILNIESRLPQVGTLDIGKMYKVFPDHIEIYKSSRLIKSITNRFVDFDQDTFATGLIGNTVQYNGKIWGVGISENINISRDYAIYNFATNPETMEKVLREFIKGL